jgi:hypothetical protein
LAAIEEAVHIYRALAQREPAAFTEDLRNARQTQAAVLDALGRSAEVAEIRALDLP